MNREFVNYEQGLELKKLGFNEECLSSWNLYSNDFNYNSYPSSFESEDIIQLPLYQQAFRWFRKKHGLLFWIEPSFKNQYQTDGYVYYVKNNGSYSIDYATYEQAEIACLNKLIEIVKNKQ